MIVCIFVYIFDLYRQINLEMSEFIKLNYLKPDIIYSWIIFYILTYYPKITILMRNSQIWSQQEEQYLNQIVPLGKKSWTLISKTLNQKFGGKQKTPKQCRQRYKNYVNRNQSLNQWSEDDLSTMFTLYENYGPKWSKIAYCFPGKAQNAIKNRFYGCIKRLTTRINSTRNSRQNLRKQLKYKSLLKILDSQSLTTLPSKRKKQSSRIRKKILEFAMLNKPEQILQQDIQVLVNQINSFNLESRSYRCLKITNPTVIEYESSQIRNKAQEQQFQFKKQDKNVFFESVGLMSTQIRSCDFKYKEKKQTWFPTPYEEPIIRQIADIETKKPENICYQEILQNAQQFPLKY